jgi:hypothetical protein
MSLSVLLASILLLPQDATQPKELKSHMRVMIDRDPVGTLDYVIKKTRQGSTQISLVHTFALPEGKSFIVEERHYDKTGKPTRFVRRNRTGDEVDETEAKFTATSAVVEWEEADTRLKVTQDLPQSVTAADKTLNWPSDQRLLPGAKEVVYEFDMDLLEWRRFEVSYVGAVKLVLFGRTYDARQFKRGADEDWWYDAQGLPLKIIIRSESGVITAERTG